MLPNLQLSLLNWTISKNKMNTQTQLLNWKHNICLFWILFTRSSLTTTATNEFNKNTCYGFLASKILFCVKNALPRFHTPLVNNFKCTLNATLCSQKKSQMPKPLCFRANLLHFDSLFPNSNVHKNNCQHTGSNTHLRALSSSWNVGWNNTSRQGCGSSYDFSLWSMEDRQRSPRHRNNVCSSLSHRTFWRRKSTLT